MNIAEGLLGAVITLDWDDTFASMLNSNCSRLDIIFLKLVFQISVYILCKERNSRRHGGLGATVDATSKAIGKVVKNRISSLKYKESHKLEALLRRWFEVYPN